MGKLVETVDLYTNFYTFEGVVKALNGVALVVNQGETYGLVGESGCGKSVSVRAMMRIVQEPGRIDGGKILLFLNKEGQTKGVDILQRSETYMESMRGNDISMIFQEASTSLNPVLSIGEQIGESFLFHRMPEMLAQSIAKIDEELARGAFFIAAGWKRMQRALFRRELAASRRYDERTLVVDQRLAEIEDKSDAASLHEKASLRHQRDRFPKSDLLVRFVRHVPVLRHFERKLKKIVKESVVDVLMKLGVPNPRNIVERYPHELSGGMQQRIVIAIALACHPTLLIADEPTSNLDVTIQAQIVDLIKQLKRTSISSVLFITHDLGLVAEVCDRVTVMYAGDACETTSVRELFKNPLHPYTKGLLNSVPGVEQEGELNTIPGVVPNLVHPPTGCRFHPRCPYAMDVCKAEKPETIEYEPNHFVACHLFSGPNNNHQGKS